MLRQVSIYGVTERIQAVAGDYFTVVKYARENDLPSPAVPKQRNGEAYSPLAFTRIDAPVETVVVDGETRYLAIEPELKELLEAPIKGRLRQLGSERQNALFHLEVALGRLEYLTKAPWYLRVWRALGAKRDQ